MEDNDINKIIANALQVEKDLLTNNVKLILPQIRKAIESNENIIKESNAIDKRNNNGFTMDFNIVKNIFSNLEKENTFYGDVKLLEKDETKKITFGSQIMDIGNVVVINDGNPYVVIEMILRNIIAGNTLILSNSGYMYGTNQLLVQIVQSVLEEFNISKYLVQIYISENFDELLANFANIDLIVCIGSHSLQHMILNKAKNKTLVSGYENFEIYIEDNAHIDFINKIINTGLNIEVYINKDVNIDYPNAIIVDDILEAIAQINYNGAGYSSTIFTSSSENASLFVKKVKAKMVTVNTSPTIERMMDIKQQDLVNEKKVVYPFNFNFDGNRFNINFSKNDDLK